MISVLMAAYNKEGLIEKSIQSFLEQTYPDKELLICDDCSTDNTYEVIKKWASNHSNIRIFRNPKNLKLLPTVNFLFSKAKGDWICFLDSDDWTEPNRLEHQLAVAKKNDADALISEFFIAKFDGSIHPKPFKFNNVKKLFPNSDDIFFPAGTLFMKREVIEKIGGFDLYWADAFCGDIHFVNKIAENFNLYYDPTHIYYYRLVPNSLTNSFDLNSLSKLELAKRLIEQRKVSGTDILEQNKMDELEALRLSILKDRKWLASNYRLYAATALDRKDFSKAQNFLFKAFKYNFFSLSNYKTLWYFLKSRFFK